MRPFLAALVTTIVPTIVGRRFVSGTAALRWGIGGMIGIALLGWGAMVGGLLGSAEAGAVVAMAGAWFAGPRMRARVPGHHRATPPIALAAVVGVGAFLLILSFWRPVPGFDAWAFWSLKAKAIAASGDFSSPVFTHDVYEYAHRDYPPLFPAWQSTAYRLSGDLTNGSPTQFQLAWLWTSAGLALVSLAGARRTSAGLVLFAWALAPQVVGEIMSGYADVPMALFLVAGTAALIRAGDLGLAPGAILLAAAAVTKTEGVVFALAVVAAFFFVRRYRRRSIIAAVAITIAFGPWAAFTVAHGLAGDLASPSAGGQRITAERDIAERLPTVLRSFGTETTRPQEWGILVPAAVVVLVLARQRPAAPMVAFLLAAGSLITIYLLTPYELDWHLSRSADRVVIAPLGLLALAAESRHLTGDSERTGQSMR